MMAVKRDVWQEAGIFAYMKRSVLKKSGAVTALVVTGLLFIQFARLVPATASTGEGHLSEKINLALRRTAHQLLLENGDSTSRIPPILTLSDGIYLLRLERPFNYDRLPVLLKESFALHGVAGNYDVAVLNCLNGELQLGYNAQEVGSSNEVTCGGRQQGIGCYNLQVTFVQANTAGPRSFAWWLLATGFLLGGISYALWPWFGQKKSRPMIAEPAATGIAFGHSNLDLANQTLQAGAVRHPLTYREAKLLHLFVSHPDQLLERDFILQSVWNDEGIIVGRSVDVFVSRLRKILQDDPGVRIVTVHGMGYRLETRAD